MAIEGIQGSTTTGASDPSSGAPAYDAPAPLLPLPAGATELTGDIGEQLALLVMKSSAASKKAHRAAQDSEEKAQTAAEDAQVADMRREADHERTAGIEEGAFGAMSVVGSGLGYLSSPALSEAGKISEKAGDAGLSVMKRIDDAQQKDDEADAKQHEFAADRAKRQVDRLKDSLTDDQKMLDSAVQFVKEYKTTRDQAMLNITRRA
jgi:hypothetical protein